MASCEDEFGWRTDVFRLLVNEHNMLVLGSDFTRICFGPLDQDPTFGHSFVAPQLISQGRDVKAEDNIHGSEHVGLCV